MSALMLYWSFLIMAGYNLYRKDKLYFWGWWLSAMSVYFTYLK